MASVSSKLYSDDVGLVVVLVDASPFLWAAPSPSFSQFLSHVLAFVNSILLLSQLNQVVVIATGYNSCGYIYDSSAATNRNLENGGMSALYANSLQKFEEFVIRDEKLGKVESEGNIASSMALCYIQKVFRSGPLHPQPQHPNVYASYYVTDPEGQILCLQGSPDGPEQYVAIMNAIFSAQHSMVPIDSCYVGAHNSAFLQQASYITGGIYVKPQHLEGLFQYLVLLTRPAGVDFHASCLCHKTTIDMGYICSVCLSIFCKHHMKCSTCGSVFGQAQSDASLASDQKRKAPETLPYSSRSLSFRASGFFILCTRMGDPL